MRHHDEIVHHVVILVLEDVAVPDVLARQVELGFDGDGLSRVHLDRVLPPRLVRGRLTGLTDQLGDVDAARGCGCRLKLLLADNQERDLVHVYGMGMIRGVVDLPLLDRPLLDLYRRVGVTSFK